MFDFSYPIAFLADRTQPNSYSCSRYEGFDYVVLFDKQELAKAYCKDSGNKSFILAMIESPNQFMETLEQWKKENITHLGFNPKYQMRPLRLLEVSKVLENLKANPAS